MQTSLPFFRSMTSTGRTVSAISIWTLLSVTPPPSLPSLYFHPPSSSTCHFPLPLSPIPRLIWLSSNPPSPHKSLFICPFGYFFHLHFCQTWCVSFLFSPASVFPFFSPRPPSSPSQTTSVFVTFQPQLSTSPPSFHHRYAVSHLLLLSPFALLNRGQPGLKRCFFVTLHI